MNEKSSTYMQHIQREINIVKGMQFRINYILEVLQIYSN